MYKEDLALNNLQWLICHKTQLNQTKFAEKLNLFHILFFVERLAKYILPLEADSWFFFFS